MPNHQETIQDTIHHMGRQARAAAYQLAQLTTDGEKRDCCARWRPPSASAAPELLAANDQDLAAGIEKGLSAAMLDRLRLDEARIEAMAAGIDQVATLPDPVGQIMESWVRPNGMRIEQVRVPIGTIGIIYESRPNVTADAAVLCFKTGNATILRGGSEAIHSNRAIAAALAAAGAPEHAIQLIPFTDRESVAVLARMDQWLDLIIPRGGKGLIETVVSLARMPVIKHYDGICHLFVDQAADLDMAVALTVDAKTQKCGVCNALETLLVHRDDRGGVPAAGSRRAARQTRRTARLRGNPRDPARRHPRHRRGLAHRVSRSDPLDQDRRFARRGRRPHQHYGSHHTDTIVTADAATAERFLREVDSACVFHNVSNRFADGGEFGFGAEIGISTDKLHARGPMGLRELTSYQYRVRGSGQTKGCV